jgi:outer membrane protein TolC
MEKEKGRRDAACLAVDSPGRDVPRGDRMEAVRKSLSSRLDLWAVSLLAAFGCAAPSSSVRAQAPLSQPAPVARLASPAAVEEPQPVHPVAAQEVLPPPEALAPVPDHAPSPKAVPVNLDTVFHLAQDQNVRINLAREKLQEAFANKALAAKSWLPEILVGPSYYRHEGGISNEDGTLTRSSFGALFAGMELDGRLDLREATYRKVDAERKVWQQRGELSRMTSDNLLDAATTYVDLLTARSAEALALEVQGNMSRLLDQAKKLAATDPGAQVEVDRVAAEMSAQRQILRKVREGAASASAKLAYLLGVDPCAELVPTDPRLVPIHFVDASRPCCDLVAQAQATGPGVREMAGLLNVIQSGMDKAKGPGRFLPTLEVQLAEGAFGTGPGDTMAWDNRMDLGMHARWNLTQLFTAREQGRIAKAKYNQAQLSYQDLRGRLAMGVQGARESSLSNNDQVREAESQIENARSAYKRSQVRLNENIKGASASEVLLSIRSLGAAQLNYLQAVRDFDKAQLRLLILLGGADAGACPH